MRSVLVNPFQGQTAIVSLGTSADCLLGHICPLGPTFSAWVMLGSRRHLISRCDMSPWTATGSPATSSESPGPRRPARALRRHSVRYTGSINPLVSSFMGSNKCRAYYWNGFNCGNDFVSQERPFWV